MQPETDGRLLGAIVAILGVSLGYSLFFAESLSLWIAIVVPALVCYFGWRFLRALERIATALENRSLE